jgi:hypothetical protein
MDTDARVLLARAENAADRKHAVSTAMAAGMPLHEIEEFLDWVDAVREGRAAAAQCKEHAIFQGIIRVSRSGPPTE